jgi:hypothetical protein
MDAVSVHLRIVRVKHGKGLNIGHLLRGVRTPGRKSKLNLVPGLLRRFLNGWRQRFRANLDQVRRFGFSDEFIRTWEFYFCYCEGAFRERAIGDVQMLLTKPGCQRAAIVRPLST